MVLESGEISGMESSKLNQMNETKIDINSIWRIISELRRLRDDLPRTAYYTIGRLEEIKSLFPEDEEVSDVPIIGDGKNKIQSIIDDIKYRFEDDEASIDRKSDIAEKINECRIELEVFIKFNDLQDMLSKFEKRMSKIADVFPPKYFDFRSIVDDLNENIISLTVIDRLRTSIKYFNEGNFENVIEESAKASEALTEKFVEFTGDTPETNWWSNLQKLHRKLSSDASPSDLRWFIWSLLNTHHKTRVAHDTRTQKIAEWMDKYRKHMRGTSGWARISVICSLQAAKEFQKLVEIKEATEEQRKNTTS